ncbi:MAG TPA: hypothetical protein VFE59_29225 [Trebonia sp.]|jgi:RNA polymerase sigma-70 factor (ECF subfamily)|nr:hypothetical protein [Trebonia sp.]
MGDRWAADLEFINGAGRPGDRDVVTAAMNGDLADKVHQQMASTAGDLTIWDMTIHNPPEDPWHCPPAVIWLLTVRGGRVSRLRLFHPSRDQLHAD